MRKLSFLGLTLMTLSVISSCGNSSECDDDACQDEYETQVFTYQETIDSRGMNCARCAIMSMAIRCLPVRSIISSI